MQQGWQTNSNFFDGSSFVFRATCGFSFSVSSLTFARAFDDTVDGLGFFAAGFAFARPPGGNNSSSSSSSLTEALLCPSETILKSSSILALAFPPVDARGLGLTPPSDARGFGLSVALIGLDGDTEDFFLGGGFSSSLSSSLEMRVAVLRFSAEVGIDRLGAGSSSLSLITVLVILGLEGLELEAWFKLSGDEGLEIDQARTASLLEEADLRIVRRGLLEFRTNVLDWIFLRFTNVYISASVTANAFN
jgi:hypothetical protein